MELTILLKLLGRNIGYNAINNRILNLWKPAKSIHLMDIANGYFLVKFQAFEDYNKALTQGPWIVYGQYLTVQPLTKDFSPSQPYPSVVLAWIRLPSLPGYLYKRKIIEAIGGLTGKLVKLDFQTDNRTRGQFAWLAIFINLDKWLVSQVMIDGAIQRVEYEALSTVCFACGKYGHVKKLCSLVGNKAQEKAEIAVVTFTSGAVGEGESAKRPEFGLWMLVERHSRRGQWIPLINGAVKLGNYPLGSRFSTLTEEEESTSDLGLTVGENSGKREKEMVSEGNLERVKTHYNPTFKESEGVVVPISGSALDLGKNSAGLGSRFKSSRNLRIPLVESIEVAVELFSPQGPSKIMNVELDDMGLSMEGDTVS
ncbi:hypothetical protein J1N35_036972 [Gossypium stocksii]|uniref:CCHC-type domain-containing protein n=1 Tax=Gossypium stocksii TaxID=47602 RepID=A0A9D3ZL65_9ROSI|nr:hypothetical protein J1N35_036972 [Gossypium stocksii]